MGVVGAGVWLLLGHPRTGNSGAPPLGRAEKLELGSPVQEGLRGLQTGVHPELARDSGQPLAEEAQQCLLKGQRALENKEFGVAREAFERVLGLEPREKRALSALAWLEQRDRKWGRSEELLRLALKQSVEDPALWMSLGVALLEQEKLEGSTAAFSQTVALEPKNARARRLLALTLGRRGWLDGAEQELRKAIELEPEEGGAHYNLAVLYLERTPPLMELGKRHYCRALDLGVDPDPALEEKLGLKAQREPQPKAER